MSNSKFSQPKRILLVSLLLCAAVGGYYFTRSHQPPAASAQTEKPGGGRNVRAALVKTSPVLVSNLPITLDAIGNVEALETVSVQSQMTGQLKRVYFTQGDYVKQGQLLFDIDARLQGASVNQMNSLVARSKANIQQARAALARSSTQIAVAEANLKRDLAQRDFVAAETARSKSLLDKKYVSPEEYDQAKTNLTTANATIEAARAALVNARAQVEADKAALQTAISSANADQASLEAARIELGFTKIYAPISGKTGPLLINAGNSVQANASVLVNIKKISPIFVDFSVPEKHLKAFQQAMPNKLSVTAKLQGESQTHTGQLVFIDNAVNKSTGTVLLKSRFLNEGGQLWPGQFVNVTVQLGIQQKALSIPAPALQKGPEGDFVYTVVDGKAQVQPVVVERIADGRAVIAKGLSVGQAVVIEGQLGLAPDAPVEVAGGKKS